VKVAAYSDVQGACEASHDVDAVVAWVAHEGMIREGISIGCDECHSVAESLPDLGGG
jgi:hypothetical protein